jgi:DNA-binding transcriptional MerR regulator
MSDKAQALVLWRTEHSLLSVEELARAAGVQAGTVEVFVRYRLIEASTNPGSDQLFPTSVVDRLGRIIHLRQELGVNLAGVAVILEMAEHMEALQKELDILRRHWSLTWTLLFQYRFSTALSKLLYLPVIQETVTKARCH